MIVTFYSFKGGVGRSMALANVAEILADWGYRVIVCDWDLEAPGLESYMTSLEHLLASSPSEDDKKRAYEKARQEAAEYRTRPGLMDLLVEYKETMSKSSGEAERQLKVEAKRSGVDVEQYRKSFTKVGKLYLRRPSTYALPVSVHRQRTGWLKLLTAGSRAKYELYAEKVRNFRWEEFYENWAGDSYIEFFHKELRSDADLILVDSRTGVTEHGGVTTHHLADMVLLFSAANRMNVEGTQWMVGELSRPGLRELRGGRKLQVFPVPARIEQGTQKEETADFHEEFVRDFRLYQPPPARAEANEFYDAVEIPYVSFYSFKERVAAREDEGRRDRKLYKAYRAVAQQIVDYGLLEGLIKDRSDLPRAYIGAPAGPERRPSPTRPPILLSYTAGESLNGAALARGLDAAGVKVLVTPSSFIRPGGDPSLRGAELDALRHKLEKDAAGAAGHIILFGSDGLDPRMRAEFDRTLRECAVRPGFRLMPMLAAGGDPKVLPDYVARLQPFELPADLGASSELFRSLAAEFNEGASALPADEQASPFLGFEHFEEEQARFFFGRDAEVAELTRRLGDIPDGHARWLRVEGHSGSGKTSLVRAGLVPAIRCGLIRGDLADWKVVKVSLSKNLFEGLALSLYDPSLGWSQTELQAELTAAGAGLGHVIHRHTENGQALLLVLDNLEALFDGEVVPNDADSFWKQLNAALEQHRFHLVTTVRSDYASRLDSLLLDGSFDRRQMVSYQLGKMDATALRDAVAGPARLTGMILEPGLLERIVAEVSEAEQPLALLGSVMRGLWEKRTGNILTHGAYQELGGARGVLLRRADELLKEPAKDQTKDLHERMRKLFLELVKSCPAPWSGRAYGASCFSLTYDEALAVAGGDDEAKALVNRLLAPPRLLITQDGGRIGILHESLISHWGRLRDWLDASRAVFERRGTIAARALAEADPFLRWSQTLRLSIENWERGNRSDELLLSGPAQAEANRMLASHDADLNSAEKEFISRSRSRASRRRRRVVATVAATLLLVALLSVSLYLWRRSANKQSAGSAIAAGVARAEQGRPDVAVEEFNEAIRIDPSSPEGYYRRGLAYMTLGLHEAAQADLQQAIALDPNFAAAYQPYGISLTETGKYEAAIEQLTKAASQNQNSAELYFYRGRANDGLGRSKEALADYDKALELDPRYAEAHNARANLYRSVGDFERALADYNSAIELKPDYAEAFNNRGYAYANAKTPDYDRAIDDYGEAIKLDPKYADAYYNRGYTYANAKTPDYDRAIDDFTSAIALDPAFARAFNGRCEVYLKYKKQPDAALADCDKATKINSNFAEAYVNLGQSYAAKPTPAPSRSQPQDVNDEGDYVSKAIESYNKALELNPDLDEVYLYRGELYKKRNRAGDRGKAVADLLSFIQQTGDMELETRARKALKELNYQTPPQATTVSIYTPADSGYDMEQVRQVLRSRGYNVQIIDSEDLNEATPDIRYFRPEDENVARELESLIENVINGDAGGEPSRFAFQNINGLVRYGRSRRVPFGTIEVRIPPALGK